MGVCGNYVTTFAEATHALPDGMHMDADYPFMIPRIVGLDGKHVILKDREEGRFKITNDDRGNECCIIAQRSSFEVMTGRRPAKFRAYPFKDRDTDTRGPRAALATDPDTSSDGNDSPRAETLGVKRNPSA